LYREKQDDNNFPFAKDKKKFGGFHLAKLIKPLKQQPLEARNFNIMNLTKITFLPLYLLRNFANEKWKTISTYYL